MRLKKAENLLHFHDELAPGETKTFTLALLTTSEEIKEDLDIVIDYLQQENGYIDRKIILNPEKGRIAHKFNNTSGCQKLCYTDVLSADDKRFKNHIEYCEKNTVDK